MSKETERILWQLCELIERIMQRVIALEQRVGKN